jgi:hypothetical protein
VRSQRRPSLNAARLTASPAAAHIALYLYPFLSTVSSAKPFEYLRLTSLGVIGALVKVRDRYSSAEERVVGR